MPKQTFDPEPSPEPKPKHRNRASTPYKIKIENLFPESRSLRHVLTSSCMFEERKGWINNQESSTMNMQPPADLALLLSIMARRPRANIYSFAWVMEGKVAKKQVMVVKDGELCTKRTKRWIKRLTDENLDKIKTKQSRTADFTSKKTTKTHDRPPSDREPEVFLLITQKQKHRQRFLRRPPFLPLLWSRQNAAWMLAISAVIPESHLAVSARLLG